MNISCSKVMFWVSFTPAFRHQKMGVVENTTKYSIQCLMFENKNVHPVLKYNFLFQMNYFESK